MTHAEEISPSLLDPETLRALLQHLETTDVDELEISFGSSRLYLRREPGLRPAAAVEPPASTPGVPIAAPLTGVYYSRPAPEEPLYVTEGAWIEVGQVVALIETMKLFNEVTAELAGEVVAVRVQDGDLVEAGQPLIYVRTQEGQEQ